mmetsp:Transcript_246/g.791  ORF Transcript_246/g.791 Transcript_246/m.791 type:complete len:303 (-) Transcript_246:64-972(-)
MAASVSLATTLRSSVTASFAVFFARSMFCTTGPPVSSIFLPPWAISMRSWAVDATAAAAVASAADAGLATPAGGKSGSAGVDDAEEAAADGRGDDSKVQPGPAFSERMRRRLKARMSSLSFPAPSPAAAPPPLVGAPCTALTAGDRLWPEGAQPADAGVGAAARLPPLPLAVEPPPPTLATPGPPPELPARAGLGALALEFRRRRGLATLVTCDFAPPFEFRCRKGLATRATFSDTVFAAGGSSGFFAESVLGVKTPFPSICRRRRISARMSSLSSASAASSSGARICRGSRPGGTATTGIV